MTRPRACGALIVNGSILMVRHVSSARAYWTLPGGGLSAGETAEAAAVREVWEETGVRVRVTRLLWKGEYWYGDAWNAESCFRVEADGEENSSPIIALGLDPEEAHLPPEARLLQDVAWMPLAEVQADYQVARVIEALECAI